MHTSYECAPLETEKAVVSRIKFWGRLLPKNQWSKIKEIYDSWNWCDHFPDTTILKEPAFSSYKPKNKGKRQSTKMTFDLCFCFS